MIGAARRRLTSIAKDRVGPVVARRRPVRTDLDPATWGLSIGPAGTLCSGSVDLVELSRRYGTPLHVVRADRLAANAADAQRQGGAEIFSSYKTNPVPAVLRRLHDTGVGAEVISPYELWLALRLGVPGDRIVYNGPAKSPDSIRTAVGAGALAINANTVNEAALISRLAADEGRTVNLGLRLSVPGAWGGQFGIATIEAAAGAVRDALGAPHVELRAIHVHRGGTMRDASAVEAHVRWALERCDELRAVTGWSPELLDLGGSLACPTVASFPTREFRFNRALGTDLLAPDPSTAITIGDASVLATRLVGEHAAAAGIPMPRVLLEPGRALTGDTQFLLTTVLDVKDDGPLAHAVLDAGINVAEPVPNEYHQLFSASQPGREGDVHYRLAGPICTPADVLYNDWRLAPVAPGHVLAIMDSGAYFVPFSTTFSFPKPAIVVQDGDDVIEVRRRERFDDIVAHDDIEL
ncbi:MAG: pyridoxal-dependent decarboxylase [Ilumatobacteraceae bacterium]